MKNGNSSFEYTEVVDLFSDFKFEEDGEGFLSKQQVDNINETLESANYDEVFMESENVFIKDSMHVDDSLYIDVFEEERSYLLEDKNLLPDDIKDKILEIDGETEQEIFLTIEEDDILYLIHPDDVNLDRVEPDYDAVFMDDMDSSEALVLKNEETGITLKEETGVSNISLQKDDIILREEISHFSSLGLAKETTKTKPDLDETPDKAAKPKKCFRLKFLNS